jgi:amino acid adenylation domain-containing protein
MDLEFNLGGVGATVHEGIEPDFNRGSETSVLTDSVNFALATMQLSGDVYKPTTTAAQPKAYSFTLQPQLNQVCSTLGLLQGDERAFLLAAFNAVLSCYTQQATLDLPITFTQAEWGKGCTTIVRTETEATATVRDHIQRAAIAMRSAQSRLDNLQHLSTTPDSLAQCSIALSFVESITSESGTKSSAIVLRQVLSDQFDSLDLHLIVLQQGFDTHAILRYNANIFQSASIQRFAAHLQAMMDSMLSNPDRPLKQISFITPSQEQQFLHHWNSPCFEYPETPIHQYIEQHAIAQANAIAVQFQDQTLTYAQLNQRANQLAHYLLQQGVMPKDRISVCVEPSLEIMVCVLAIFKAGATYVPLDPTHPTDRLGAIVEDTQPKLLLTQAHLLPHLPQSSVAAFCLDRDWAHVATLSTENLKRALDLDQTAYVVYTSGTTGNPKGVMVAHRNLVHYILVAQQQFRFNSQDVMPAIARFTFSINLFELFTPLVAGGRLVVLEREHILDFKRMVETLQQVTVAHLSPSLLRKLLAYIKETGIDSQTFKALKHISSGGDMVPADLLETMRQVFTQSEIYVIYGSSEVSCMGTFYAVPTDQPVAKTRVGKPFSHVSVRLYDEQQNPVPVGVVGEVYFSGAGIVQGYLNREELTQEKFILIDGQRFYRMGDMGRFDADGNLELLGRSDFQIKLRGIRIEPTEIEMTLRQAPGIRDSIVAARELGKSEKSLIAYVVPTHPSQKLDLEEIRRFLQTKLPDYMIPVGFVVLEALPVNLNQKIDRRALPDPTPENLASLKPFVAPKTDYEARLVKIWEDILGISPIGIQDNFFDVGGDSLQAVTLMMVIETTFGKTLPLSTLLTEPTVEQLAAVLQDSKPSDLHNSIVVLRQGGCLPPIFLIHDGEGETLLYRNLAMSLKADHPVYGIQPYSQGGFPMLHTRLEEVIDYYTEQIQQVQPEGPYFLGGLCIGGYIGFEVARRLQKMGHTVGMVALIDTADLETPLRSSLASQRLSRFSKSLSTDQTLDQTQRLFALLDTVRSKTRNLIKYEVQSRSAKLQLDSRMRLLRFYRDRGLALPSFLAGIPVRVALKFAERGYVPDAPLAGEVVLFRATEKSPVFDGTEIDDTPYTEIYDDPLLGWGQRATDGVKVIDTPGGHSSMLQEPHVQVIAHQMQAYIDAAIATYEQHQAYSRLLQTADADCELSYAAAQH